MGRVAGRGYHIFFGVALLTLASLGAWWTVFIRGAVEMESEARLHELLDAARLEAAVVGHGTRSPVPGPIVGRPDLEWISSETCNSQELCAPALPNHPTMSVRPTAEVVEAVRLKTSRRRLMIIGEGTLLFVLLGVCTGMLYRLVRQERSNLRRMELFVSAVTHEMKTPLAGVKSLLQTLSAGRVPPDQEPRLLALGLRETERLQHSIENVLLVGNLRTDRFKVRLEPVELRPLLEAFLEHRRPALVDDPAAIRLEWEQGGGAIRVLADPSALRVILENLTDNALEYGGPSPRVILKLICFDDGVRVSVEDQGVGFDSRSAEQLFAPFNRVVDHHAAVQHGTGLGLSIARTLARRMGGDLTGSSPGPGQGSVFTFTLRRAAETSP